MLTFASTYLLTASPEFCPWASVWMLNVDPSTVTVAAACTVKTPATLS